VTEKGTGVVPLASRSEKATFTSPFGQLSSHTTPPAEDTGPAIVAAETWNAEPKLKGRIVPLPTVALVYKKFQLVTAPSSILLDTLGERIYASPKTYRSVTKKSEA
jgi:hypothetical protein